MCPVESERCGRIACPVRILPSTVTCRCPFRGRSYCREEWFKPDSNPKRIDPCGEDADQPLFHGLTERLRANSTSARSNTIRVTFSCLFGRQPCLHRMRLTSTRRFARTFSRRVQSTVGLLRTASVSSRAALLPPRDGPPALDHIRSGHNTVDSQIKITRKHHDHFRDNGSQFLQSSATGDHDDNR